MNKTDQFTHFTRFMSIRHLLLFVVFIACGKQERSDARRDRTVDPGAYQWSKLTDTAHYPPSSELQFINIRDTVWAFHPNGIFYSTDGISFQPSNLDVKITKGEPAEYILFNNRLVALGSFNKSDPKQRPLTYISSDLRHWKEEFSSIPARQSYRPVVYKGRIWIFGGRDSTKRYTDAWSSPDASHWTKVADSLPFGNADNVIVLPFNKKLLALSNPCFESEDGIHWKKLEKTSVPFMKGRTPVLFNNMIWLFGCPGLEQHDDCIAYSDNARIWKTVHSPWQHRTSPAACVFRARILLSSGSHRKIEEKHFSDSLLNDIWQFSYNKKISN